MTSTKVLSKRQTLCGAFPVTPNLFWVQRISEVYSSWFYKGQKQREGINKEWLGQDVMGIPFTLKLEESETLCRCASTIFAFCFMITLCLINSSFILIPTSETPIALLKAFTSDPVYLVFSRFRRPCGITEISACYVRRSMGNSHRARTSQHMDFPDGICFALDFSSHHLEA